VKLLPLLLLVGVSAAVEAQLIYTTVDATITITGYTGPGAAVIIPDAINGLPVTLIGNGAFLYCSELTSIAIPNSVISIGNQAFESCTSLTSLTIPNSVTNIGTWAFGECVSLTSVSIGNSVTTIGVGAFEGCTSLTSVSIGNSVTNIGSTAFSGCTSLTGVTIPNSVTVIGGRAFYLCNGLTNVTIGDSVTSIGDDAFGNCTSLTSVTIPDSVASIGDGAFTGCNGLAGVYFKGDAPGVGSDVFFNDPATVYYLPGTTGWGAKFGGRPTALWNPPSQISMVNMGVQTNQFGFTITGTTNLAVVVEACTNLVNPVWSPVATNTLTGGSSYFSDPRWTNYPACFYRLRSP
jgi:hypothetical protein